MRKTRTVTVPKFPGCDNRDLGRVYFIEEWPAARADNWMMRVAFAFNKGGGSIPQDVAGIGWEGIAVIGINTFLRGSIEPETMIPLCDELLECVKIIRDPKFPDAVTKIVSDDDIEEVATRWWLRDQVVSVHVGFSPGAALFALLDSIMTRAPKDSPNTSTSPPA
ncbi:hypothetical protein [Bradyrhizobium sp.]